MKTKTCKYSFKKLSLYILIFSLFTFSTFSQEEGQWVVAAEKFSVSKGQSTSAVKEGITETLPKNILEKLNKTLVRNIQYDEELERVKYELRTKRQSLYLQLSSEYKKRDSLFLSYSGKNLEKKIKEQNKEIDKIKNQIEENLEKLKESELEAKNKENLQISNQEKSEKNKKTESEKTAAFFKSLISNEKSVVTSENVKIYNENYEDLYTVSEKIKDLGYEDPLFEKTVCSSNINALISGSITNYEEYIGVYIDLYLYPGAKKIGSIMEVGSINDLELIASSIVSQLIPILTNSMPVKLSFSITPDSAVKNTQIYIDDVIQENNNKILINSGVHKLKIVSEGYKTLSTSYFFEGNTKYNVDVKLEEENEGSMSVVMKHALPGNLYIQGSLTEKLNEKRAEIKINGTQVLGQFVAEDNTTSFFYIPEKQYYNGNAVQINPKPMDRGKKIDIRRRWMYGAYSAFMVSLIPAFIVKGQFINNAELFFNGYLDYETALKWQTASNVCAGVSIGLGVFWGIELVRYLIAANSVLPEKAKPVKIIDLSNSEINEIENDILDESSNESVQQKEILEKKDDSGDKK